MKHKFASLYFNKYRSRAAAFLSTPNSSVLIPFLIVIFVLLVIRRAWVCDDAYITFRTIDNFFNGYRLTWNVNERVQVYTHPLWMLLVALFSVIFKDIYLTSIFLSVLLAVITLVVLCRKLTPNETAGAFLILALALSKSFVDFSTSGLENSLSHLLAILFFWRFFRPEKDLRNLFWLSLISSLAILNRMDTGVIYLPALLYAFWQVRSNRAVLFLLLGQIPFLLWELFATFYYGFPFPNTAYAKLNTGLLAADLVQQGLLYLLNAIQYDPVTPLVICAGLLLAFRSRQPKNILLALGTMLYLLYTVKIGGDFMEGRFLTLPLICAAVMIARLDFTHLPFPGLAIVSALLVLISLSVPNPTLRLNDLGPIDSGPIHVGENGILNERMLYYGGTGLLNARRNEKLPNFYWGAAGERFRNAREHTVIEQLGIGLFGYYAGPDIYILDRLALADPLLARLPMRQDVNWRVGHYERMIPAGYKETLLLGKNMIEDPNLALFYDKLSIITRGSLTNTVRLAEIWKMNTGQYDHLIHTAAFQYPDLKRMDLEFVSTPLPAGTPCADPGVSVMDDSGVEILLPALQKEKWLQLSLDHNDKYRIFYFRGEQQIGVQAIPTAYLPEPGGISIRTLRIPSSVVKQGFDRVHILPLTTDDGIFCLGHLLFIP
jgi:arabinofuranosyltransferase